MLDFFKFRFILKPIKKILERGGKKMFVIINIIFVIYILLICREKNYIQIFMLGRVATLFHNPLVIKNKFISFE